MIKRNRKIQNDFGKLVRQSMLSWAYATRFVNHRGKAKNKLYNRKVARKRLNRKIFKDEEW